VTEIGGQDGVRAKQLNLLEPLDFSIIDVSRYPAAARDSHVYTSSAYSTALGYRTTSSPTGPIRGLGGLLGRAGAFPGPVRCATIRWTT
jgi:putative spermidine/putrescine transport system substrate-binding protein